MERSELSACFCFRIAPILNWDAPVAILFSAFSSSGQWLGRWLENFSFLQTIFYVFSFIPIQHLPLWDPTEGLWSLPSIGWTSHRIMTIQASFWALACWLASLLLLCHFGLVYLQTLACQLYLFPSILFLVLWRYICRNSKCDHVLRVFKFLFWDSLSILFLCHANNSNITMKLVDSLQTC